MNFDDLDKILPKFILRKFVWVIRRHENMQRHGKSISWCYV